MDFFGGCMWDSNEENYSKDNVIEDERDIIPATRDDVNVIPWIMLILVSTAIYTYLK